MIIGNGGAELGARGFVSAYDAETGKLAWRFYMVPGDSVERLSRTKPCARPRRPGRASGGRTAVAAARRGTPFAYDPEAKLLYVGTGNGSAWDRATAQPGRRRQPLSVARSSRFTLQTGELAWYYQETPAINGITRPYSTSVLADLPIGWSLAQGADAGPEERLLLRARSDHGRAVIRRAVREGHVGERRRQENRAAHRDAAGALRRLRRDTCVRGRAGRTTGIRCRSIRRRV